MKKFVLTLAFFFATFSIMAQEHLSFKGIPIQGSLTEFCKKLEAKGFKDLGPGEDNNSKSLTGTFAGQKATVSVDAINNGEKVVGVLVYFDSSNDWKILDMTYQHFKSLYCEKYGLPIHSVEENNARSENNTSQMLSLMQGTTNYACVWDVFGGHIYLMLIKDPFGFGGTVGIKYEDSQNATTKYLNELDDI